MNALNLRISSVKTGENIRKNAEMRTSPIVLPVGYFETVDEFHNEFLYATTVQEQVELVKSFMLTKDNPDVLSFLVNLYFISPLKHPVRNQITK